MIVLVQFSCCVSVATDDVKMSSYFWLPCKLVQWQKELYL